MSALPDITTELARIRGKLARRLYSPASEQDVTALLDLVTDALAKIEQFAQSAELWAQRATNLETEVERLRQHPVLVPWSESERTQLLQDLAEAREEVEGLRAQNAEQDRMLGNEMRECSEQKCENDSLRAEIKRLKYEAGQWMGFVHPEEHDRAIGRAETAETKVDRQRTHLNKLQAEVMRLRADDAERKARDAEAIAAKSKTLDFDFGCQCGPNCAGAGDECGRRELQPSVPDEWGATDLHTEMARVRTNLDRYSTVLGQGAFLSLTEQNQCAHDLRATLAALYRADSVIHAQAHDLAKERENSAALRAEINDVVAERNQLAEAIQAANRPETHNRIPALPGVEHYTDTLAKLPDVEARLRWVLAAVYSQQHAIIEVSVPPDLLREALTELDYLRSLE